MPPVLSKDNLVNTRNAWVSYISLAMPTSCVILLASTLVYFHLFSPFFIAKPLYISAIISGLLGSYISYQILKRVKKQSLKEIIIVILANGFTLALSISRLFGTFENIFSYYWNVSLILTALALLLIMAIKLSHRNTAKNIPNYIWVTTYLAFINTGFSFLSWPSLSFLRLVDILISLVLLTLILGDFLLAKLGMRLSNLIYKLFSLVSIFIIAALIFPSKLFFEITQKHHQNFYLGPALSTSHGQFTLVHSFSQYGNGVIYFISSFLGINNNIDYFSFTIFQALLTIGFYVSCFLALKYITKRPLLSFAIIISILSISLFSQYGYFYEYPSTGVLRFGLPYLILFFYLLKSKMGYEKLWRYGKYLILGLAAFWSFETFFYTAAAFMGAVIAIELLDKKNPRGFSLLISTSLKISLAFITSNIGASLGLLFLTGKLPLWSTYWQYLTVYSSEGFGSLAFVTWSPVFLLIGLLMTTGIVLFAQETYPKSYVNLDKNSFVSLAILLFIGGSTLSYYIYRPEWNNLKHIAPAFILIVGIIIAKLLDNLKPQFKTYRKNLLLILVPLVGVFVLIFNSSVGDALKEIPASMLLHPAAITISDTVSTRDAQILSDSQQLAHRYFSQQTTIPLLIKADLDTELLLKENKINQFPIGNSCQDGLVPYSYTEINPAIAQFKAGDNVIIDLRTYELVPLQQLYLKALSQKFTLVEVENTPGGIALIQLKNKNYATTSSVQKPTFRGFDKQLCGYSAVGVPDIVQEYQKALSR